MKQSTKGYLLIFLIVSVMAFVLSSVFASVVTIDNTNSTKLTAIQDDSFEPHNIQNVQVIVPKVENNTNNNTSSIENFTNNVKDVIECEIKRQTELLDKGKKIIQETRRYDDSLKQTFSMREKVDAVDYKYFIEPNIPKIKIDKSLIEEIRKEIPMLPFDRVNKYMNEYNISRVDANTIVKDKNLSAYYEKAIEEGGNPTLLANWITGTILSHLNKFNLTIDKLNLEPSTLSKLIKMVEDNKLSTKQAREVLNIALEEEKNPLDLVKSMNITQISDETEILKVINEVLEENPNLVKDYKDGKRVFDFIIGQIMKKTRGKVNPGITAKLLRKELEK